MSGLRALLSRALLSLLVTAALVGASLARLSRVPRPRFVPEARAGDVEVGGVWVGARRVGLSVRCGGREVWGRPGRDRAALREGAEAVTVAHGDASVTLARRGCAMRR